MPLCRLCETRPTRIKAHAIPQSFFVKHLAANETPKIVWTSRHLYPRRCPIGVYDPNILCEECETKFQPYDDYGFKFFFPTRELEVIHPSTEAEANIIHSFDYPLLKLFILSTLWRASVSTQKFYAGVKLGPYEDEIRHLILSDGPGSPQEFPIVIYRFAYPPKLIPTLCPVHSRISGLNFYQLLLNGFLVMVKVDRQPMPPPLNDIALAHGMPLIIPSKDYRGSIEHRIMAQAARNAEP